VRKNAGPKWRAEDKNAKLTPKMPSLCQKCQAHGKNAKLTAKMPSLGQKCQA